MDESLGRSAEEKIIIEAVGVTRSVSVCHRERLHGSSMTRYGFIQAIGYQHEVVDKRFGYTVCYKVRCE